MALRTPGDISPDQRYDYWIRVVERCAEEQTKQGQRHRNFRLMRAVFVSNDQLGAEGGFLFNWMAENYVDASLMLVRRELDVQAGTENLRNLLEDMEANAILLARSRYRMRWGHRHCELVDHMFDSFSPVAGPDGPESDYIPAAKIAADLRRLTDDGEQVRLFAERTRAHRTPDKGIDQALTFSVMHGAIADIRKVLSHYYALLTQKSRVSWEPEPQYDTLAPFTKVWAPDPRAVVARLDDSES